MKISNLTKPAALALLSLSISSMATAEAWTGHIGGYLGGKSLSSNDSSEGEYYSSEFDDQGSLGLSADIKHESWPVSLTLATFISGDIEEFEGDDKVEMGTFELQLGVQKNFDIEGSAFTPYLGLGVAFVSAEIRNTVDDVRTKDDDTKAGGWIGGGLTFDVTQHFDIGIDVRYSDADLTLFDVERSAGGVNTSLRVGYHF